VAERPVVVFLGGPTASGKTEASLVVAETWGAHVLSADAMQVYRGMDIGTAKASAEEQARVPHHGIDVVDPDEPFAVADFLALAQPLLDAGTRLVVAGGTSLYMRALVRGLVPTPSVDPALRAELEARGDLYAALTEVDPALAARLHPNDRVRLVRGMEVYLQSGQRLSELQAAHAAEPDKVEAHALWLDRDDLYARIDARVEAMVAAGYVDEVGRLLDAGHAPTLKPMRSLGYRHLAAHLLGALPLDEAVRRTQRDTRHFARKQRTWANTLRWPEVRADTVDAAVRTAEAAWGTP
jgi:tRNA dimethylallyltransferase